MHLRLSELRTGDMILCNVRCFTALDYVGSRYFFISSESNIGNVAPMTTVVATVVRQMPDHVFTIEHGPIATWVDGSLRKVEVIARLPLAAAGL